jgi:hypothetical protein
MRMAEYLNEHLLQGAFPSMKGFTHEMNSATHGDPLSAQWNVVLRDGAPVFLSFKKPPCAWTRRRNLRRNHTLAGSDSGRNGQDLWRIE